MSPAANEPRRAFSTTTPLASTAQPIAERLPELSFRHMTHTPAASLVRVVRFGEETGTGTFTAASVANWVNLQRDMAVPMKVAADESSVARGIDRHESTRQPQRVTQICHPTTRRHIGTGRDATTMRDPCFISVGRNPRLPACAATRQSSVGWTGPRQMPALTSSASPKTGNPEAEPGSRHPIFGLLTSASTLGFPTARPPNCSGPVNPVHPIRP